MVVQCRYNSVRLPGKALLPLAGVPMLTYLLRRILAARLNAMCCVATTTSPVDDAVAACGTALGLPVVRGEEQDVLARYIRCTKHISCRGIVRITADNPFTAPELVEHTLTALAAGAHYADTSRCCPLGTGVDGFSTDTLFKLHQQCVDTAEREHINLHILRHPENFYVVEPQIPAAWRKPWLRLTVDTEEDYAHATTVAGTLAPEELLNLDAIIHRAELTAV